ncbi:MAG TPA: histidine kinase [Gemmatimonadales bacterium]|nr:histidine kinase [Gemmatimonadales bacterium]
MHVAALPAKPHGLAMMLGWRRIRFTLGISIALGLLLGIPSVPPWHHWRPTPLSALACTGFLGLTAMLVFGLFEQRPKRLPRWIERWVLQVVGVALAMPVGTAMIYWLSTAPGAPPFYDVPQRFDGFWILTTLGILIAPWAALGALVRQKEAFARHQALAFELARSELERQASEARLRLLQAQVAPHFLFNTLANVQALVDAGSPQAKVVLRSLVAYLRAAVPRLDEPATTLGQELDLVQAYLELMQVRMPDRLQFALHVDEAARVLRCPPMTLLTLVENAVRHGIDPSEEGGLIDIHVERRGERCVVRVRDTGAGLKAANGGLGTGLSTLRERLQLTFFGDAELRMAPQRPSGVSVVLEFPARTVED